MISGDACDLLCLDLPRAEALRRSLPDVEALRRTADRAKALSDPTRLRLALALRDGGELCGCDLAWVSERQDKLVSHHLRQLRAAGLARSRKDGRIVLYVLTEDGHALLEAALAPAEAAR